MIKYENLITKSDLPHRLKQWAQKIYENGWKVGSYPAIKINEPIIWEFTNENERSWNYHKHCWAMLDPILTAHSEFMEQDEWLQTAIKIALDWSEKNVSAEGEPIESLSKFAWYDMAVGLRAQRLAYIIDIARQRKLLTLEQDEKLWQSLKAHQSYLEQDSNIAFHSNHGYYQAAGQIAMGRRFSAIDSEMRAAQKQGIERFHKILAMQFSSEGVHLEHSPDYHRMVYNTLTNVLSSGLIEDATILEATKGIEQALSWFVTPHQRVVCLGDSSNTDLSSSLSNAQRVWQTPEMRYVVTNGEIGELTEDTLKVFKEGGYYIVRFNQYYNSERYDTYSYLVQTAAFHSRTHKHADDLSFVWHEHGHEILIDAGRYGYVGKAEMGSELWKQGYWYTHPHRRYCESTRAHNTLEFDEENYPRKGVKPYGSAIGRYKQYDNGLTVLESECKHFKSIRRVRVLIYMPHQWLIVYDWFKDNLDDLHDVRQWFNFSPHIKLNQVGQGYHSQLDENTNLHITNLLAGVSGSEVIRGQEEPRLQGWYSAAEREFEPIDSINYKIEQVNTGSVATLFSFNGEVRTDLDNNQVNVSGRRLKVTWLDDKGEHEVSLIRDKDEPISVDYQYDYEPERLEYKSKEIEKKEGYYYFEPYKLGIKQQVRLAIQDIRNKEFVILEVIDRHGYFELPIEDLDDAQFYKYKYQIVDHDKDRLAWKDSSEGYFKLAEQF